MNIAEFRSLIAEQLELDRRVKRHRMSGPNLDALLMEASKELGIPLSQLDYELEERGSKGFMGIVKPKDFSILVYRSELKRSKGKDVAGFAEVMVAQEKLFAPTSGRMFVHVRPDGVYLKLIAPKNGGSPVLEQDVLLHINRLLGEQPKRRLIRELCRHEFCDYTKVAEIAHLPKADARINIRISQDCMQAKMVVTEPGDYGAHLQYANLIELINDNGISYGYNQKFLQEFCDAPVYDKAVIIAEGKLPVNGKDLYIEVFHRPENEAIAQEEGGKINLRSINKMSTVVENTVIGKLHESSSGEAGYNVLGERLEPVEGKTQPYTIGAGCRLDDNTKEILASTSGEVVFEKEKQIIKVLEICVIEGNLQNDIDFPGSIIIKGDVDNGYNITAEANVTIIGHLGKTRIECGGSLIIKAGINAVDAFHEVLIHAKDNIYTRYINNAGVASDKSVIVEDGILGSTVFADEYIICHGKRGIVNASTINARLGIYAKSFGSVSGTSTELVVGMPQKIRNERDSLQEKYDDYRDKLKPLKQGISVQNRQKEIMSQRGTISEALQDQIKQKMDDLQEEIAQIEGILHTINARLQELETETDNLCKQAFISNEKNLNPGVVISIGMHHMDVQSAYSKGLTFRLKNDEIHPDSLEDFDLTQFDLKE